MNEAIATKALQNLRARVAELEALADSQAVEMREAGQARQAEVERLRAELDDAMNGWKKADTEAEQARAELAKTSEHRAYLQDGDRTDG